MVVMTSVDWPWLVLLFALGLSATAAFSAIGLAGGALVSPVLILVLGLKPRIAVGTTVVGVFAAVLSASLAYLRQKRVNVKLALLFDALDVVGVALGAYLTTVLRPEFLASILGAFLVSSGTRIMAKAMLELRREGPPPRGGNLVERGAEGQGSPSYRLGIRELVIAVFGSLFSGLAFFFSFNFCSFLSSFTFGFGFSFGGFFRSFSFRFGFVVAIRFYVLILVFRRRLC